MCWDTRLNFACDWFLQKDGRSFCCGLAMLSSLIVHCLCTTTTTSSLFRLVIESHCCKAGRKKKGVQRSFNMFSHVYALLRFCGPDPLPPRRSFCCGLAMLSSLIVHCLCTTTTTSSLFRLVIESHCCKAGRKKKGVQRSFNIYIYIYYIEICYNYIDLIFFVMDLQTNLPIEFHFTMGNV